MKGINLKGNGSVRIVTAEVSIKRNILKVALALALVVCLGARAQAAALIVSADDWPTKGFNNVWNVSSYDENRYVQNVGNYFANGNANASFLVLQGSSFPVNTDISPYGYKFGTALDNVPGKNYSVTYNSAETSFSSYAGVFLNSSPNAGVITSLTNYLLNGGNVYVYGGQGNPAGWNPLLNTFGLNLTNMWDGVEASVTGFNKTNVVGSNIFAGVDTLYANNASPLTTMTPMASGWSSSVIATQAGKNYFAEAHAISAVPAPPALALLGIGLLGFVRMRKKIAEK